MTRAQLTALACVVAFVACTVEPQIDNVTVNADVPRPRINVSATVVLPDPCVPDPVEAGDLDAGASEAGR